MAVSLCGKQTVGALGLVARKALTGNVSSLDCQRLWWWAGSEALAPTSSRPQDEVRKASLALPSPPPHPMASTFSRPPLALRCIPWRSLLLPPRRWLRGFPSRLPSCGWCEMCLWVGVDRRQTVVFG